MAKKNKDMQDTLKPEILKTLYEGEIKKVNVIM
jgi:hypothetical protein